MNLVVVMLGFLATITLVMSYAVNDYTAQKSTLKHAQISTALQQATIFTNTEFNNYKLYTPNNTTPLNNLPDTFMPNSDNGNGTGNQGPSTWFKNGFGWGFGAFNMPSGQSGSSSAGNTTSNQLSCGNNWPSSSYLYTVITPHSGFTQIDARKLASALQNKNWNFQGFQTSSHIQINVGYIDQNGLLQPFGYNCNQSLPANTVVEVIGPMT